MPDQRLVLTPPSLAPKLFPTLLRDVLRMKRNRGDHDAEAFKLTATTEFASGLNATISGAGRAMGQWAASRPEWVSDARQARRMAFLSDLEAVQSGDMRGWDVVSGEAA